MAERKEINVEDIVKISKESKQFGQNSKWGKVEAIADFKPECTVKFADGSSNTFNYEELVVLKKGDKIVISEKAPAFYDFLRAMPSARIIGFGKEGGLEIAVGVFKLGPLKLPVYIVNINAAYVDLQADALEEKAQREAEKKQKEKEQLEVLHVNICPWLREEVEW